MQFTFPITVEPNTTEANPERLDIKLDIGVLTTIEIYFPWGCAGLVGVRVLHYEQQLSPNNVDEWFTGNEIQIRFNLEYWIVGGASEFHIEAYNDDELYEHEPVISFNILRSELAPTSPTGWVEA